MRDIVAKYGPGGFRTERSLYVKIADVKNMGEERDTYVAVLVDDVHRARTPTVYKSASPLFSQEYDMDLENEAEVLTIQLKPHVVKKKEGEVIGTVNIRIGELAGGAVVEKWFPLSTSENFFATAVPPNLQAPAGTNSLAHSPSGGALNPMNPSSDANNGEASNQQTNTDNAANGNGGAAAGAVSASGQAVPPASHSPVPAMTPVGSSSTLNIGNNNNNAAPAAGESSGEIRIAIQYSSVTVLADDSYDNLFRLLLKDKMAATVLLSQASAKKEKVVADCLVKAFEARKTGAHYIKTIVQADIDSTANPNIIFRGNTVATKSVDTYMRLVGQPYLSAVLGSIINEIFQGKKPCEVDVQRLTKERAPEKVAEKNMANLLSYCKRIFEAIASSFNRCPAAFRNIFEYIQDAVVKKFPGEDVIRYTAPGGFIFLRFFCPALLGPKLFNLANDHPPENIARDLTLIAKTIQNLANLVPFGQKEPYMEGVNPFIAEYSPQMKAFLDTLCSPPKEAIDEISSKVSLNFGKEMARIHAHLSSSLPTITDNIHARSDPPELVSILEETKAVLAQLNTELANFPSAALAASSAAAVGASSSSNSGAALLVTPSGGIGGALVSATSVSSSSSASLARPVSPLPSPTVPRAGGTSTPPIPAAAATQSPEESSAAITETMLLKRKLHHLQFIQEQQAKLAQLEKALSSPQSS